MRPLQQSYNTNNFNNTSPIQNFDSNPFSGANINISTTNLTCFNIGCTEVKNNNDFAFNKART